MSDNIAASPAADHSQNGAGVSKPIRFRATGFNPRANPVAAWASFFVLIGLWQIGCSTGFISELAMPSPVAVGKALWHLLITGQLWLNLEASLERLAVGWLLGTVAGLVVGFAVGMFSWARSPGVALVSALFPIPKIALLPLFIIWFGIGEPSKFATIGFGVFFPTVINTFGGVDNVARNLIRMGQSFDMSTWSIVRKIILPGALPTILSGFRISSSIAIILLIAAEMIGAEHGIGALILAAGNLYQTDQLIAGVVVLSLLGLCVSWLLGRLDKWLLGWR